MSTDLVPKINQVTPRTYNRDKEVGSLTEQIFKYIAYCNSYKSFRLYLTIAKWVIIIRNISALSLLFTFFTIPFLGHPFFFFINVLFLWLGTTLSLGLWNPYYLAEFTKLMYLLKDIPEGLLRTYSLEKIQKDLSLLSSELASSNSPYLLNNVLSRIKIFLDTPSIKNIKYICSGKEQIVFQNLEREIQLYELKTELESSWTSRSFLSTEEQENRSLLNRTKKELTRYKLLAETVTGKDFLTQKKQFTELDELFKLLKEQERVTNQIKYISTSLKS